MGEVFADKSHLVGNVGGKIARVPIQEIETIVADRNYVQVTANGMIYRMRGRFSAAHAALAPHGFMQVHRSILVNHARVAGTRREKGHLELLTRDGNAVAVSRSFEHKVPISTDHMK